MCFFKVKHHFGHISGMVGLIEVKQTGSASVGYWVQYVTLTFDLTHDLDLGCFKVKFWNSSLSGIIDLIDVKWKQSELIWYWADCMTLPFDHTHDLDPGVEISRFKSEIALSQAWDSRLTWNEKDVSHPFMTMILTSVTMLGWADVSDSDWGDFRRLRALDISSLYLSIIHQFEAKPSYWPSMNCLARQAYGLSDWWSAGNFYGKWGSGSGIRKYIDFYITYLPSGINLSKCEWFWFSM